MTGMSKTNMGKQIEGSIVTIERYKQDNDLKGGLRARGRNKESTSDLPLITVITVVLNCSWHLERTILSVINQNYKNIEYIIIDGGSTDGTLDIIKKYENGIDYWISENDEGIYDAMNKGLDAAHGEWIFFLGADDILHDSNVIENMVTSISGDLSLIFGDIKYSDNKIIRSKFGLATLLHNTVHHQSALYNAELFRNWRFDRTLKVVSDYELNLIIYLTRKKHKHVNLLVSICSREGISRTSLNKAFDETNTIRRRYLNPVTNYLLCLLFFIKYNLYKIMLRLNLK